jgi:hypothetical protein
MPRPDLTRIPEYYHQYINQVPEDDLLTALRNQHLNAVAFLKSIPALKYHYRYAEGKWALKEVLQHMLDAERIFAYRALCFARQDATPLPSFDENLYAENCKAVNRNWNDMVEEFSAVRKSTEILFRSFDTEQLETSGIASGKPMYVMGIGFIIAGHVEHHIRVIREKYLN